MATEIPTPAFRELFARIADLEARIAQVPVEVRATLADEKARLIREMTDWIVNATDEADHLN